LRYVKRIAARLALGYCPFKGIFALLLLSRREKIKGVKKANDAQGRKKRNY
jgi:hypothetical protein